MSSDESADTDILLAWVAIGYTTWARCELIPSDIGYAVILWLGDDEMLVAEMWPDRVSADDRAARLRAVLVAQCHWLVVS